MNIVMGMWGWGFLISPVISGILADPVKQYSDTVWFTNGTFFGKLVREYPFILPNLLGTILCVGCTALAQCFLYETLHIYRQHSITQDFTLLFRKFQNCLYTPSYRYESVATSKSDQSDHVEDDEYEDTIRSSKDDGKMGNTSSSICSILSQGDTRACILLLWGYSFVGLAIDEAFPLFCLSHTAGFGSIEKDIGKIMSLTGLIFAVAQYFVAHYSYKYCGGLSGSTKIGAALSAPTMFLVPLALLINRNSESLIWPTYMFLAIVLSVHRCFSMVFFSNIAVTMNRTVPTAKRGAMNGVAGLGASISKAIGPTFAGFLTTYSVIWIHQYASLLIFGVLGTLGVLIALGTIAYLPNNAANEYTQVDESIKDDNDRNGIELEEHQTR
jgi:MFS family permease